MAASVVHDSYSGSGRDDRVSARVVHGYLELTWRDTMLTARAHFDGRRQSSRDDQHCFRETERGFRETQSFKASGAVLQGDMLSWS
ncbi:hypothetical protein GYH30_009702 [Glycine max]|nr:hypothetical protein GYH30_009702 [Glycine max]